MILKPMLFILKHEHKIWLNIFSEKENKLALYIVRS